MANLANLTIPITKRAQQPDGSVIIEGPITDDSLDLDRQIVDAASAAKALKEWFDEYANVRQQHSPILAPAGKGVSLKFVDGVPWLKAHIIEPTAVKLVNARVYQAYSIGIGDGTLDTSPAARKRAPEGVLYPTLVNEVSVVDYPANVHMGKFMIAKRKDGAVRDVAKVKVAKSLRGLEGDSLVEALKSVHAGAIVHTASSEKEANELIGAQFSPSDYEVDGNVIRAKRQMDPNVGGGVDRDKIPAKDFAGKNRSFPIVTPGDVSDAASSIGRAGPDNYTPDKLKARIIAIAQRKGPEFVSELPKKWRSEMGKAKAKKAKKAPGSKKPFPGAAPPFKGKGDETATDETTTDDTATTKPSKKAKKAKKGEIPEVDQKVTEDLEETHTALTQAQADQAADNAAHESGDDKDDKDTEKAKAKKEAKSARKAAKAAKKARTAAEAETALAMKRAHDVLCPVYKGSITKSLGSVAQAIDPEFFRSRLMSTDESSIETYAARAGAYTAAAHVATLKMKEFNELRAAARKAFRDAYPDVKVKSPDLSDPSSFQRGFLPSANKETATSTSKPSNFPDAKPLEAGDFTRGPLTTNQARPTLSTGTPAVSMVKSRQFYTNADKDKNEAAMATLHDHIVANYPNVCPAGAGLADETTDRLGTPPEMYSPASGTSKVDTHPGGTLVGVGAGDAARAVKKLESKVKKFAKKDKAKTKAIKRLERSLKTTLNRPDMTKAARRRTDFAAIPGGAQVSDISDSKKERLQRAKMLSTRIHDRHSAVSLDEITELQDLVSPEQFAALMTAED